MIQLNNIISSIKDMPRERLVTIAVIGCAIAAIIAGSVFLGVGIDRLLPVNANDFMFVPTEMLKGASFVTHLYGAAALGTGGVLLTVGLYILIRKGAQKLKMKFDCLRHLDEKMDKNKAWSVSKIILLTTMVLGTFVILGFSLHYLQYVSASNPSVDIWIHNHYVTIGYAISPIGGRLMIAGVACGLASLAFVATYTAYSVYDYMKKKKEKEEADERMHNGPINNTLITSTSIKAT